MGNREGREKFDIKKVQLTERIYTYIGVHMIVFYTSLHVSSFRSSTKPTGKLGYKYRRRLCEKASV